MGNYLSYARTEILTLAKDSVSDRQLAQLLHTINTAYGGAEQEQRQEDGTSFLNEQEQPLFTASNAMFDTAKDIRAQSQNPTAVFLLAAAQGWAANAAVGGACAEVARGSTTAVLTVLAVHPDWQRSGIALKLLQDIEAACAEKGATTMSLEVNSKDLHHYFAKQGYTEVPSKATEAVDLSMLGAAMALEKRIDTKTCVAARKRVQQHRALKDAVYKQVSSTFPDMMPFVKSSPGGGGSMAAPFGDNLAAAAAAAAGAAGEYQQAIGRTSSDEYAMATIDGGNGNGGVSVASNLPFDDDRVFMSPVSSESFLLESEYDGNNGNYWRGGGDGGVGSEDTPLHVQSALAPAPVFVMPAPPTQPYDSEYLNGCLMSV